MGDFGDETETETLTVWGSQGNATARMRLAAFTWTPPMRDREAVVIWVHPHDLSLMSPRMITGAAPPSDVLDGSTLVPIIRELEADRLVFVTADAGVTLQRLHEVLTLLAETRATVALAVPLPPGATFTTRANTTDLCPNGLPDPGTTAPPPSNPSDPNAHVAVLRNMQTDLQACMQSVRGLGVGNVVMSLRIGASGEIVQACVKEDQTTNAEFRSCLLSASRRLQFPRDWAHNDLNLPLRFRAEQSQMIPLASICR